MTDKLLDLLAKEDSLRDSIPAILEICEFQPPAQGSEYKQVLRQRLERLKTSNKWTPQLRGYELERLVLALAAIEGMKPAPSFRPAGEQVDGLLDLDGRYFLLETKWQKEPICASDVYAFLGKVMSKFDGTCGIFMAMGQADEQQFARDAKDALIFGKALNILLCQAVDIEWAFGDKGTLRQLVRTKLRYASQRGEVLYIMERRADELKMP